MSYIYYYSGWGAGRRGVVGVDQGLSIQILFFIFRALDPKHWKSSVLTTAPSDVVHPATDEWVSEGFPDGYLRIACRMPHAACRVTLGLVAFRRLSDGLEYVRWRSEYTIWRTVGGDTRYF